MRWVKQYEDQCWPIGRAARDRDIDRMIPQLPFGNDDFVHIQTHANALYVDKTRRIADLFMQTQGHSPHLFLARPRRFGKTLLLSTVEALFQGRRDLFANTWIGQEGHWDWEERTRPVLRLNLDVRDLHTPTAVRTELTRRVRAQVRRHRLPQLPVTADAPPAAWLEEIVYGLWEDAGRRVVVLVDEYDTALTENLDRPDVREDILDVLRAFYGALKSSSRFIECTLVTGITRLARASLFSGANQLVDLSHRSRVHGLLGFTQAEIHSPPVAALVVQGAHHLDCTPEDLYASLERQYNGYRFATGQEAVYNPYTLAGCLEELAQPDAAMHWSLDRLPSSWIHTGTPKMMLRGLRARRLQDLPVLEGQDARPLTQVPFDTSRPDLAALLFQAGYLTLDAAVPPALTFPNREVQAACAESLVEWLSDTAPTWLEHPTFPLAQRAAQLQDALLRQDADALRHVVGSCMEAVPLVLHRFGSPQTHPYEPFYQALLHVMCQFLDLPLAAELQAGRGRADLALELPGRICLLELKVNRIPEAALRQAFGNFYPAVYGTRSLPVTIWGLQFDRTACTLQACRAWDLGRFDLTAGHWENEPFDTPLAELRRWPEKARQTYVRETPLQKPASSASV